MTPLMGTALSTVPKVSANGVCYLGPAWGFVVSLHGYPCKPPVTSGAQGSSASGELVPASPQGWPWAEVTRGLCILGLLGALPTSGTCPLTPCHSQPSCL